MSALIYLGAARIRAGGCQDERGLVCLSGVVDQAGGRGDGEPFVAGSSLSVLSKAKSWASR